MAVALADPNDDMQPAPRFEPIVDDGEPTVRDNQTGKVLCHEALWTEAKADEVARDLTEYPGPAYLLTWEEPA